MSDEEIVLKRLKETLVGLKGKNVIGRIDFQIRAMIEDCIRVIEKQQKEIEENKKYIVQLTDDQYRKLVDIIRADTCKEWKDKIKAKIEEVKDGTFDAEIILHQLLEKE